MIFEYIVSVKACLSEQFSMTDLGPLRYFLGIEVSPTSNGFFISQEKYIQNLLARVAFNDDRTVETPMALSVNLCASDGELFSDPTRYRHLVGCFVYLGVTRPDISYHIHILSQFVSAPTSVHYSHLLHVYDIFMARSPIVSFFLVPTRYSSRAIQMLHGPVILRIAVHFLLTVFFLVVLSLPRRRRNKL